MKAGTQGIRPPALSCAWRQPPYWPPPYWPSPPPLFESSTTATPARLVERARVRRALEALQVGDLETGDVDREVVARSSNCS